MRDIFSFSKKLKMSRIGVLPSFLISLRRDENLGLDEEDEGRSKEQSLRSAFPRPPAIYSSAA